MIETKTIYIQLLDEGSIDVFRPVAAIQLEETIFKILGFENYDPETETWEFLPGEIVKAQFLKNEEGQEFLTAVGKIK